MRRTPVTNLILIGLSVLSFLLLALGVLDEEVVQAMVLGGGSVTGWIGHLFLHAGLLHLGFNMLYLWVFGNAVCDKLGSGRYALVYLACGLAAAAVHLAVDGAPAVGASGAINGILGVYLVIYPLNRVNCVWWFAIRGGMVQITGFWILLFWFGVDAWRALGGAQTGIAYWAHIGGFLSGISIGAFCVRRGWVAMADFDNPTLLDWLDRWRGGPPPQPTHAIVLTGATSPAPVVDVECPHCLQGFPVNPQTAPARILCPLCGGAMALADPAD